MIFIVNILCEKRFSKFINNFLKFIKKWFTLMKFFLELTLHGQEYLVNLKLKKFRYMYSKVGYDYDWGHFPEHLYINCTYTI